MRSDMYAPYKEFDLPTRSSSASPRVLDRREFDRVARPRYGGSRYARDRRPFVIEGGRLSSGTDAEAVHEGVGTERPGASYSRFPISAVLRIALVVLPLAGLLVVLFNPSTDTVPEPVPTATHVVQPGDTLWEIADTYTPDTEDIRNTITLIRDLNGMASSMLIVGDVIDVPVGEIPGLQ